ncbi:DUF2281 domain-containing protein [Oscillatoriales cyanobacterium LEGE 11467]|uniref:DUF2281 domain-containing protein n=1 Tax=Zarconia navalis LEGE 11467 TaxID=1828826 RepID=A0A928W1W1_9CYAN|nr:DUF2281 domain-containing protein [Zarconia navalis]MBE9041715.1 DUF2281 domain-containing protein [Zarconia navalis LEGE 11467]
MTIRDIAINKLQQLSDPLLQEAIDFIDFLIHKHQVNIAETKPDSTITQAWSQWFETVDRLEVNSPETSNTYQQLLLDKYRQE